MSIVPSPDRWVTVNLPWILPPRERTPEERKLQEECELRAEEAEREHFGTTREEVCKKTNHMGWDQVSELQEREPLLKQLGGNVAAAEKVFAEIHASWSGDMDIMLLAERRLFNARHAAWAQAWDAEQEDMNAWRKMHRQLHNEHDRKQFRNHPANRAGVLIEVQHKIDDGGLVQYLIGDLNAFGGFNVDEDGSTFEEGDIVLRYLDLYNQRLTVARALQDPRTREGWGVLVLNDPPQPNPAILQFEAGKLWVHFEHAPTVELSSSALVSILELDALLVPVKTS